MTQHPARPWHGEFSDESLSAVRHAIPLGIQRSQTRSANAHAAYGDKDGDKYVYGAGMSRGVYKELVELLSEVPGFREVEVEGSRRKLIAIDNVHLYPLRIGAKMPRNHTRVRVSYMPEQRQEMFRRSNTTKFDEPALFDNLHSPSPDEPASISEALAHQHLIDEGKALVVAYYSCTPAGVGSIYWAPAKLSGTHHLEFLSPESLAYVVESASSTAQSATRIVASKTFADGTRPRTATKLRTTPKAPDTR
ncbi:hypothetical protein BMF89_07505 [Arthrobacter sp. SRS-W-1-2016]|nr:hypothetical protein BMF89_07505 [Arthrobacter sp. SRS-W-1-2016]